MMLSKKSPWMWYGFRTAAYGLMVLAVLLAVASTGWTANEPKTVAEIALYQEPGRERLLIEGAKKEGQLVFYSSNLWLSGAVAKEFEKKYPFIKVSAWRTEPTNVVERVLGEYSVGQFKVDVIESSRPPMRILQSRAILQEFSSPEASFYDDEVKIKGKIGVYALGCRELYMSLGFNTKLVPPAEAPKTHLDLLDPKWKGKMSIVGGAAGIQWLGIALDTKGRDYLERLSRQDVRYYNVMPSAVLALIISGESYLSPVIANTVLTLAKNKGAPVEWRPLEPVGANLGLAAMTTKAPHPHAALLFLDYIYSKEGQQVVMKGELMSPREDMGSVEKKFKKVYFDSKYSVEEYEKKYNELDTLMKQLFIKKP